MGRIFFGTGGSEANETAIKLARQYHCISGNEKKHRVISRKISYHGGTLGALSATSFLDRTKVFEPLLLDFPKVNAAYPYRSNSDELDLGVQLAQELEKTIKMKYLTQSLLLLLNLLLVWLGVLLSHLLII